jgi:hypothetical protein
MELSITNNRLQWLEERLSKLEKDAVKVVFKDKTKIQSNDMNKFEDMVLDEIISKGLYTKVERKPNPKQFNGVKSEEPFVKTRKRKPKTIKDWEDEFDLGGNQ